MMNHAGGYLRLLRHSRFCDWVGACSADLRHCSKCAI